MSMFYELMMRKKEQIMYATIKGTLTENDGVFSGFSASNYLKLQQKFQPADKNWEIVIKTEITQLNVVQTIIGSSTNSNNIQLSIRDTNTLRFYRTTNGTTDAVANSSLTIDSLGVCYFKISFNGSQYKVSVSQDGNNYIDYITTTGSTPIYNNSPRLALGVNGRQMSTEYFRGSIDLNNSYIKIGSTKYNLQAVVGYTIVGSPTITDGVVSGFSSANYLQIQKQIFNMQDRIEIVCKFRYSANTNNAYIMSWQTNNLQRGFYLSDTGKIRVYWSNTSVTGTELRVFGDYTFNSDTDNYVKIIKEGNTLYLYYSTDGITYTLDNSATNDTLGTVTFGTYIRFGLNYNLSSGNVFSGQIDLNETYIKVNNKVMFNGQPS